MDSKLFAWKISAQIRGKKITTKFTKNFTRRTKLAQRNGSDMKQHFTHKTIAITGAAGGLGTALCEVFGESGARIAALDLNETALQELEKDLTAKGIACLTQVCNVTQPEACELAIKAVTKKWGGIDVLINNAGITYINDYVNSTPDMVRKVMEVNFFGSVNCTHYALPSIIGRKGLIVTISSVSGFAPLVGRTGYAASKHALHGFFETLRVELKSQGVDVLMVCPAYINTNIRQNAPQANTQTGYRTDFNADKSASPRAIAEQILYAAQKRKRSLITHRTGKVAYWLYHLFPSLYDRIMLWNAKKN